MMRSSSRQIRPHFVNLVLGSILRPRASAQTLKCWRARVRDGVEGGRCFPDQLGLQCSSPTLCWGEAFIDPLSTFLCLFEGPHSAIFKALHSGSCRCSTPSREKKTQPIQPQRHWSRVFLCEQFLRTARGKSETPLKNTESKKNKTSFPLVSIDSFHPLFGFYNICAFVPSVALRIWDKKIIKPTYIYFTLHHCL